jgi:phosphoesterase RecJ-like protein
VSADRRDTLRGLSEIAQWLRPAGRVVVLTHTKPDGDALGSALAVVRALRHAPGPPARDATAWFAGPMPTWTPDVARADEWRPLTPDLLAGAPEPDAIVVIDTGAWSQLSEVESWLRARRERTAVIDHHVQGDDDVGRLRVVEPSAAAAAELAADLALAILGLDRAGRLPLDVAGAIYLGISTDTGWFRFANVRPETMRLAAELIEAGVDHAWLFEVVEQQARAARLRLLARAMGSLHLFADDRIAVMTITQQDFRECRAGPEDSSNFSQTPLAIGSVRVSILITEGHVEDGAAPVTRVSFRSKGSVDVNEAAKAMGGGGHANAAGCRVRMPLDQARDLAVAAARSALGA